VGDVIMFTGQFRVLRNICFLQILQPIHRQPTHADPLRQLAQRTASAGLIYNYLFHMMESYTCLAQESTCLA
jgi:hypothetical protein